MLKQVKFDRSRHSKPLAAILLIPVAVAIVVSLFAWPSARLEPRDLPVAVAGPPQATDQMAHKLAAQEGAFDVQRYASEDAARDAIDDRDVYGAFVATPSGLKVLTASAASANVAQMLTRAANELNAPKLPADAAHVEDAAPAPAAASALPSVVLPMILAGSLTAALVVMLTASGLGRSALLITGSVLAGFTANAIVQSWLEVVDGNWFANAGVLSLTVLSIAAVVAGLNAWFGTVGTVVGALTMILIGNPFSGISSAPEMLPQPVGDIGQLIPPGAGGNLLRSTGFFDGAAAGGHVAVLSAWAIAGLGLLLVAGARSRRAVPAPVASAA